MTRACHSIFKGYLTYTGGPVYIVQAISSLSLTLKPTLTPTPANMVSNSLAQRMRKLQTKLLSIRLGSGAFVLPKDIKKIHLRFAPKINGGHMGPRYVLSRPISPSNKKQSTPRILTHLAECSGATSSSALNTTTQPSP